MDNYIYIMKPKPNASSAAIKGTSVSCGYCGHKLADIIYGKGNVACPKCGVINQFEIQPRKNLK